MTASIPNGARNGSGAPDGAPEDGGKSQAIIPVEKPNTRSQEENELLRWPYMIHALEDTLDADLIEGRGQQLLFQALNQKTAVAFVGSGLPMAFGRLSWSGLQTQQYRLVKQGANVFLNCARASVGLIDATIALVKALGTISGEEGPKGSFTLGPDKEIFGLSANDHELLDRFLHLKKREIVFHRQEVDKLFKTFGTLESDGHFIGGEGPPIILQVAEKLQDVLGRSMGAFLKPRKDTKEVQPGADGKSAVGRARFGFLEDSEVSPAPGKLLEKIAPVPNYLVRFQNKSAGGFVAAVKDAKGNPVAGGLKADLESFHKAFREYHDTLHRYDQAMWAEEARLPLATISKMLLIDECAHAEQILQNSVEYSTASGRKPWISVKADARRKRLNRALRGMDAAASTTNLRRDIHGIRDKPERYGSLAFFKTESFLSLMEVLSRKLEEWNSPSPWREVISLLDDQLQDNRKNDQGTRREVTRVFVSPTHRFVFQMMMAFFEDPYEELGLEIDGIAETDPDWVVGEDRTRRRHIPRKVRATDFQSRQSIMDAELDPLEIVAMRLGISRFLTTNYDLEIERFYQDRGYRRFTAAMADDRDATAHSVRHRGPDVYRVDGIGGTLRDQVFRRESAADLVGFALDEASADAHVFHLHGCATADSTIVATERDYMDLYLQQDLYRETVDESIRIGFAANPLIFLGLGMQEADVLRPLRQFMSDRDRAVGRTAIVLLPGNKTRNDQSKEAATIYLRYGAHTIHYGWAEIQVGAKGSAQMAGLDWLYHADQLVSALKNSNKQMRDTLVAALKLAISRTKGENTPEDSKLSPAEKKLKDRCGASYEGDETLDLFVSPDKRLERLTRTLGTTMPKRNPRRKDEDTKEIGVLALLAGQESANIDLNAIGGKLALPQFRSRLRYGEQSRPGDQGPQTTGLAPLEFECGILAQLLRLTVQNEYLTDLQRSAWALLTGDNNLRITPGLIGKLRRHVRELNARIVALEGLPNAIITGALCASLASLEQQWQDWWRDWQLSPPHRTAKFATLHPRYLKGKVYLPRRYTRHRLANDITNLSAYEWDENPEKTQERETKNIATLTEFGASVRDNTYEKGLVTGVQSFDTFLDAVETRRVFDHGMKKWDRARRWFCVAAPRGTGRGAFLSAFQTARGLGQYIASAWPHDQGPFDPLYVSAIFINLSFSTEIASTYDMLSEALLDTVAVLEAFTEAAKNGRTSEALVSILASFAAANGGSPDGSEQFARDVATTRAKLVKPLRSLSRLRQLERLFEQFRVRAESVAAIRRGDMQSVHPRLLLCLTGVDMLHYAGGLPKNREVEELLTLLTKEGMRQIPYDLVLVTNEDNLGEIFVENTAFLARYRSVIKEYERDPQAHAPAHGSGQPGTPAGTVFVPINRQDLPNDEGAAQTVERRMHRSGIRFVSHKSLIGRAHGQLVRYGLTPPDGDTTGVEREPTALVPVAEARPIGLPKHRKPSDACYVHFARVVKPVNVLVDNFLPLAAMFFIYYEVKKFNSKILDISENDSRNILDHFRIPSKPPLSPNVDRIFSSQQFFPESSSLKEAWNNSSPKDCLTKHGDLRQRRLARVRAVLTELTGESDFEKIRAMLREPFDVRSGGNAHVFLEWRGIRTILNNNRYCLTILLAAAQRHALSGRDVADGVHRAQAFIRKTIDHVKAVSSSKREETVLHDVLDAYEAFHVIGEPHNDCELHLVILRHLAVIGSPCSADILVRTPQILDYFDKLPEDRERSRNLRVIQALTVLAERGLIFRLEPHPRLSELYHKLKAEKFAKPADYFERGDDPEHNYRYGLHRLMQRHILQKMGSGPREFAEINSFAPSVYASMPADLPRLNQETYQFLRELVDSLSQYPDRGGRDLAGQRWHFGEAPHTTRVQALRCALSLVRSTFSVAVVSRFEGLDAGKSKPPRGYFEAYRVQVRWLIRKAWEVFEKDADFNPLNYRPEDGAENQLAAFYRDEIVWLYNECGVICLVQGNLRDAASLLRQAIHFNRDIEGLRDGGPQYNRLSLNLAITQIERGRLDGAFGRLQAICESERRYGSRPGRIWHIAYGYLGLVQHLRGDLEDAERRYRRAIEVLRAYDDSRACSIFSKHLGDLERMRGRVDEARRHIDSAISFAQAGGHEDLHKRARLSLILLDIVSRRKQDFSIRSTLAQLRLIEDYSETMEMPSLLSDVHIVRAKLLLEQGESTLAGSLLARAMVMAKRNGMNLRLNSAMTSYAKVLAMRGLTNQANQLLFTCLDMAKRSNNQIEISRVEAAFDDLHQISRLQDRREI